VRANTLAPYSSYPWKLRGATELRLKRPQDAKDSLTHATSLQRKDWQSWVLLGQANETIGDRAGAQAAYREALRCAPATGQLHNELLAAAGSLPAPEPNFSCF
jgi:Flp pilus assembly protein TadD